MITARSAAALAAITVTAGSLAACGTTAAKAPASKAPAGNASACVAGSATNPSWCPQRAVRAVPGSDDTKYVAGPFTVTMTAGMVTLPARFDSTTDTGQDIPVKGSVIVVRNTSATFTGWAGPEVEYVAGDSLKGPVADIETADPDAGTYGQSSPLAPGQSETLYAQYQGTATGEMYAQLVAVRYATAGTPGLSATTVQLKY